MPISLTVSSLPSSKRTSMVSPSRTSITSALVQPAGRAESGSDAGVVEVDWDSAVDVVFVEVVASVIDVVVAEVVQEWLIPLSRTWETPQEVRTNERAMSVARPLSDLRAP